MGNAQSALWDQVERTHRLLGLALSDTTYMDSRHLEHFSYPLWNTELAELVAMSGRMDLMVSPQFPMWVSAVELPILSSSDPDHSGNTEADGTARGVYVDIAISLPIVLPRLLRFFGSAYKLLRGMNLYEFIRRVAANDPELANLPPRCLWVDELWAPILMEIKKPATRHPDTLEDAARSLKSEMNDAQYQVVEQGTCQFCSWRFASQDVVILIAGTHNLWSFLRFARSDAASLFGDNECFNPGELIALKADMEKAGMKPYSQTEQKLLYSNPKLALAAKKTLQEREREARARELADQEQARKTLAQERKTRFEDREERRNNPPEDGTDPDPNYTDRSLPLFTDDDIDRAHERLYKKPFFEDRDPLEFFGSIQDTTSTLWSGALRLGTPLSNQYKQFLADYLKYYAAKEDVRRKGETFHD